MPHGHQHESPQKVCQIAVVCQKVPLDEIFRPIFIPDSESMGSPEGEGLPFSSGDGVLGSLLGKTAFQSDLIS